MEMRNFKTMPICDCNYICKYFLEFQIMFTVDIKAALRDLSSSDAYLVSSSHNHSSWISKFI